MKQIFKSRKAQLSFEAWFVMVFILLLLPSLWLSGPIQQTTEKSIDTNDILLAEKAVDEIANAVKMAGIGGKGERYDFVVHVPFNTVDIVYDEPNDKIIMTVLLYNDATLSDPSLINSYEVDGNGDPSPGGIDTPFYYVTVEKDLPFKILNPDGFPFCNDAVRKTSTEVRGPGTRLLDFNGDPIKFCCEAGFNLHMYAKKKIATETDLTNVVEIRQRGYYRQPVTWQI